MEVESRMFERSSVSVRTEAGASVRVASSIGTCWRPSGRKWASRQGDSLPHIPRSSRFGRPTLGLGGE